jgi:Trp operon repressor
VHCDRTDAIVEDLQEGKLSQAEIARKYGVSRQYITKMKRKVEKWNDGKASF